MKKRKTWNPKRQLQSPPASKEQRQKLADLASRAQYGGNPEHKRNPGDFGLTPPSGHRLGKTLCDAAGITTRAAALDMLREGMRRGLVSEQIRGNEWPQNVWAVSEDGIPLEAQLEQQENGTYHAYPMQSDDALAAEVLKRWKGQ